MVMPDVNVLVAAYRADLPEHERCRAWLESVVEGDEGFGLSDLVLSGFVRVVTSPRVFDVPAPPDDALRFADTLRDLVHCVAIRPGERHWGIFSNLCRSSEVRGNLIADAYVAAMAIETGSEWVTLDGDFGRFPGLRWSRPPMVRRVIHQAARTP